MPDLEEEIAQWRTQMSAGGVKTLAVLDELESHLREEIHARISAGDSESAAFQTAVARIGNPGSIRAEFSKISGAVSLPVIIGTAIWVVAVLLIAVFFSERAFARNLGLLLLTHVLTFTAGYLAAFLAGVFAIIYVCCRWAGTLSPASERALNGAVVRFSYISGALVFPGFLLGMLWTHQHRGAAWQNDPREIGALCVCVWFAVLCLAYSTNKVSNHTRMVLSIIGNMMVAQAWFGAGFMIVNPAMHWYGVMHYPPLQLFMGAHLLFLLMAFSRKLETAET